MDGAAAPEGALVAARAGSSLTRDEVQAIVDTCKSLRSDVIVLCHGGPIAMPKDAEYILQNCQGVDGFYGASSMERLPTEIAITKQIKDFKGIRYGSRSTSTLKK